MRAFVYEIFSSIQGEGTHVGRWHVFVRFSGCHLRCCYCDTPDARTLSPLCRVHFSPPYTLSNPVGLDDVVSAVERMWTPSTEMLSLTGGEPMLYPDFIIALSEVCTHPLLLETAGVPHSSASKIADVIDVAACDVKLKEHRATSGYESLFQQEIATIRTFVDAGVEVCVKVVVLDETTPETIAHVARALEDAPITLVLQPATTTTRPHLDDRALSHLKALSDAAIQHVGDVRVIPQLHVSLGIR